MALMFRNYRGDFWGEFLTPDRCLEKANSLRIQWRKNDWREKDKRASTKNCAICECCALFNGVLVPSVQTCGLKLCKEVSDL